MKALRHTTRTRRGRPSIALAVASAGALALAACGGGSGFEGEEGGDASGGDGPITVLIGSSGDAETKAVRTRSAPGPRTRASTRRCRSLRTSTRSWPRGSRAASRRTCSTSPPTRWRRTRPTGPSSPTPATWPTPTRSSPTLTDAFTFEDQFWCAPKDFSTLALIINNKLWKQAGLTDDDVPTTWEELRGGGRAADEGQDGRTRVQPRVPAGRRLRGGGRRWSHQRGGDRGDGQQRGERRGPRVRQADAEDGTAAYSSTSAPVGAARHSARSWAR